MNNVLMEQIIRHIFANFAIFSSTFVNQQKTKSLKTKEYLLPATLEFKSDNDTTIQNKVWGCQLSLNQQEMKILLGDCSLDKDSPEYCLIVNLKNAPIYGLYLSFINLEDNEPLIACSLDGKEWMECSTYLQATFLAGMEQIRETGLAWNICSNFNEIRQHMISFIKFHNLVYEDKYERQENRS